MIQTALAINGLDCTSGDGNTAEEYEAIAVLLLRIAEAIRKKEAGTFECAGKGDKLLASVLVHVCDSTCKGETLDTHTVERFSYPSQQPQTLRAKSLSMIDEYRRMSKTGTPAQE